MNPGPAPGRVYLVGAGPGALDLVTLRARQLIEQADVLVYDYLCNAEMLRWAPAAAEIIYAGKVASAHTLTQDEINALLVAKARSGKTVVRLKGGDPYVFGRGGEEAQALVAAGLAFEVVPGVTSAIAAPAYAGIPVTHRDYASSVTFITGHEDPTKPESSLDWSALARLRGTKVFLMGVERLREITARLMAEGADPTTPMALVRWGTHGRQGSIEGTLATIADLVAETKFAPPAVTVVGDVVRLRKELNWFEARPLFGQRIVVTRTRQQAGALTARLVDLGADVLEIPTIRINALPWPEGNRARLPDFSRHFDWLVFASPNAVDHFFAEFFRTAGDMRDLGAVKLAAIGPATARKLRELHLRVDLQPEVHTAAHLGEKLAQGDLARVRFCLPHGDLADPLLGDCLRQAGGVVEEWTVYETVPETEDVTGARSRYLREGAHWITFTSASTAINWFKLDLKPADGLPQPKAISMGPVTSAELHRLNLPIAGEASAATIDSLVETICGLVYASSHANHG